MRRTRVGTLVWKELRQIRREPRLLAFILFAPLLMLFLFGVALRLQLTDVPLALVDEDHTFLSMMVNDQLWRSERFVVDEVTDVAAMRDRLDRGTARVGVRIPPDFSRRLMDGRVGHLEIFTDGTMPAVAVAVEADTTGALGTELESRLRFADPAESGPPPDCAEVVALDVTTLYNEDLRDEAFFLPGVIGILVLQVALVLATAAIVREKEQHTLEQLLVVPLERHHLVLGKLLPYGAIAFADFGLVMTAGLVFFHLPFAGSPVVVVALTALYIACVLCLGLLLSTLAETQQQAIFSAVFVLIPSILLSGFVFPIEAMPTWIQPVSRVLPLTHYLEIIRGVMLKGIGIDLLWPEIGWLTAIGTVSLTLAVRRLRRLTPA